MSRALAPPDAKEWARRADWFWRAHDINAGPLAPAPDARADAILAELELVFCAGADAATVILAWTMCEGRARARDVPADLDALRERRNRLIHGAAPPEEGELKAWAEGAVRSVFKTLFEAA